MDYWRQPCYWEADGKFGSVPEETRSSNGGRGASRGHFQARITPGYCEKPENVLTNSFAPAPRNHQDATDQRQSTRGRTWVDLRGAEPRWAGKRQGGGSSQ
jgi:hypothetical protein